MPQENNFISLDITNEQLLIMGPTLVQTLYSNIRNIIQARFSATADEATDVKNREQLNIAIRWFDDNYEASEEPLDLTQ